MNPNSLLNVDRILARHIGLKPDLRHLKYILAGNDLGEAAVTEDSSVTAADGKKYRTKLYSMKGVIVADHFVDVNKTIAMPKTAEKAVPDFILTNNQFSKLLGVRP